MTGKDEQILQLAAAFNAELNAAYGLYLDATMGFAANVKTIQQVQEQTGATDDSPFLYSTNAPTNADHMLLHKTTQGALKERNGENGPNYILLARFLIVLIYELWETGYRSLIADAAGCQRDDLQSSIFGDLRLLRHEILHNKGRLNADTRARLEIVDVSTAQSVDLDVGGVERLVRQTKAGLDTMVNELTGVDPGYRTVWRLVEE